MVQWPTVVPLTSSLLHIGFIVYMKVGMTSRGPLTPSLLVVKTLRSSGTQNLLYA